MHFAVNLVKVRCNFYLTCAKSFKVQSPRVHGKAFTSNLFEKGLMKLYSE